MKRPSGIWNGQETCTEIVWLPWNNTRMQDRPLNWPRSQKQIADFNLQHSQIKAPSDGKIQKILVETNEVIGPGYPAILFASTENDWVVRAALTDKDIVKFPLGIRHGLPWMHFRVLHFKAEVTELGTVADPVTGTYEVELLILQPIPSSGPALSHGYRSIPPKISRSLVVPIEALLDANDIVASVFIYQEGMAKKRKDEDRDRSWVIRLWCRKALRKESW